MEVGILVFIISVPIPIPVPIVIPMSRFQCRDLQMALVNAVNQTFPKKFLQ